MDSENRSTTTTHLQDEHLFATFLLNDLEFAIDAAYVRDAITIPSHIAVLPESPEYVRGIIDLRDMVVPIIDTRKRFQLENGQCDSENYIAVINCKGRNMGLTFDRINEVIRVKEDSMETLAPEFQAENDLLAGIIKLDEGRRLVQIINPLSLFDYQDPPASLQLETAEEEEIKSVSKGRQFVVFPIDDRLFGIDVEHVQEIIEVPEITQRVLVEDYILGMISLRGEPISVLDFRLFLGIAAGEPSIDRRLIILQNEGQHFGVLVDAITEVTTYHDDERQPMPFLPGTHHAAGLSGVVEKAGRTIVILDLQLLFGNAFSRLSEHAKLHAAPKKLETHGCIELEDKAERDSPPVTYIIFELDGVYGVDISNVREIVRYADNIRYLPGQAAFVCGILNLRAEIIPIIDLKSYLGLSEAGKKEALIMIFTNGKKQVGVLVDRLVEIKTLFDVNKKNIPSILVNMKNMCRKEIVSRVIDIEDGMEGKGTPAMIIDIPKFIDEMVDNDSNRYDDSL